MNNTSRSWLGRGAWSALALLMGLLLSTCGPAGVGDGTRASGDASQSETAFKILPAECLSVDADGTITIFDSTKAGCELKEFTIPSEKDGTKITAIGENAFKGKSLARITIPNSVRTIGKSAFFLNLLTSITLPNEITTIEESIFSDNQLASISIPNSVTSIGENAFANNPNLRTVALPDPNQKLSFDTDSFPGNLDTLFNQQNSKKAGTWTLGDSAWTFAVVLSADCLVVRADGTITIFDSTKAGCELKEFAIPSEKGTTPITAIGDNAFKDRSLTSLIIPDSVETIGDAAFHTNQLTSLIIPDSVETIGDAAFHTNQLTSLSIGNNVRTIGDAAFHTNQLTSLIIPGSVETIGNNAFANNELTDLSIGSSVETIGDRAFWNNPNLVRVVLDPPNQELSFGTDSFPSNLDTLFNQQNSKKAGTWIRAQGSSVWYFVAK